MNDVSIAALQAFRALARSGSFTGAAVDLGCAQSAVSRHIAALEGHLKQALVLRGHRRIQLTPAGEAYLETVKRVLDELEHASTRLAMAAGERPTIRVLAMPSFASRWLIPRLGRLQLRIDIDIELTTSMWDADYRKERFDLAIHYGDGAWPGAQLLVRDTLVPVASPLLLKGKRPGHVRDLAHFTWLHDALRSTKWAQWLSAFDQEGLDGHRHMTLPDADATLTGAMAGLGVAIGHAALIARDVQEGRLVELWPEHVPLSAGYQLIQSKRGKRSPAARALAQWLIDEAAAG